MGWSGRSYTFYTWVYAVKGVKITFQIASHTDNLRKSEKLELGADKDLRKLFKGKKEIEVHHLVEKRFVGKDNCRIYYYGI